jgi:nitrate/nitrite-specific signal transduction histidine kinase
MKIEVSTKSWANTARALVIATTAILVAAPVSAQFLEDAGDSQRINFSGKLRMLSQRVPAAACYVQAGIDTADTTALLLAASDEFEMITAALEFGNPDIGIIGAEERRKTQVGLGKLNELWAPVGELARSTAAGGATVEDITSIAEHSVPLLDMAKTMVTVIVGEYAQPAAVLQSDAMLIDIAGRQRMLAQRMSKNVCLIAAGINVEVATAELQVASETFHTSLMALKTGMPAAGIMPPPNDDIANGLDAVIATWVEVQPIVNSAVGGEALDAEQLSIMFHGANALTGMMNATVGRYSDASKLGV